MRHSRASRGVYITRPERTPERFRMIVGGIALAMVAWALVLLWMQD